MWKNAHHYFPNSKVTATNTFFMCLKHRFILFAIIVQKNWEKEQILIFKKWEAHKFTFLL